LVRVPEELRQVFGVGEYAWVQKAAYGVPGAPRGFYKFAKALLTGDKCQCACSKQDESVFVRRRGDKFVFIAVWVDDFMVLSNCDRLCAEVRDGYFGTVMGETGNLDYMLGVNFTISVQHQSIKLASETTIESIVQRFGTPIRAVSTPAVESSSDLMHEPLPEIDSPLYQRLRPRAERYRSQVPAMLYANTTTRPDVSWIIGILCRCLDNPTERHMDAADYCMAYLHATKTMGVQYGGVSIQSAKFSDLQTTYSPLKDQLESLSDSDWSTGKSISGFILLLALGAIMWASKKQAVTSLSSAEAEYYAASACGAEILAMRHFLRSIGATCLLPTPLHIDNSACVDIAKDFNACKRARHIDRRINFLTDYEAEEELKTVHIPTAKNTADVFTKPLGKIKFIKHRDGFLR
jgi:hypothetical protein